LAPTIPLLRALQAPNSTEEVLSQLGHRHSGTLAAGAPLPSVAETGPSSADAESQQAGSAVSGRQAGPARADQGQQAEPRQQPDSPGAFPQPKGLNIRAQQQAALRLQSQSTQAWHSLHNAPPQLPLAQQQVKAPGSDAPTQRQQREQQGQDHHHQQLQQQRHRASAEASAAEASALFGTQNSGMRQRQTSDEHRRGDVAELSSYGWLSTGGGDPAAAKAQTAADPEDGEVRPNFQDGQQLGRSHSGAALKAYSSGGSAGGGGGRRISRDSDRCAFRPAPALLSAPLRHARARFQFASRQHGCCHSSSHPVQQDSDVAPVSRISVQYPGVVLPPGCRGEDEVPALPRTARDSDTAAWVASGLEERQSEEQAADRTTSEVRVW
jgi:hypothetical protein